MILDLQKFISDEQPFWNELDGLLGRMERDAFSKMDVAQIQRFHYLYQRASADLAKVSGFSAETDIRRYLENLVARSYAEVHEVRQKSRRFNPLTWFLATFPQTFRRHIRAFALSLVATIIGTAFGAVAIGIDSDAKAILMPFSHLQGDPSDRVKKEEQAETDEMAGHKSTFAGYLMTHNTKVSIFTFALGATYGVGTMLMLFYNGVILGAVALDYMLAGETPFLIGWLLPHGSIEIPAILLAGQAGFILASAVIGWGKRISLKARLRQVSGDLATLMFGIALMLIWAGIIESFFSQYHEPVLPYALKIGFGAVELAALALFLGLSGRKAEAA